jgi:hypothetical protein
MTDRLIAGSIVAGALTLMHALPKPVSDWFGQTTGNRGNFLNSPFFI